jgi:hypothetical protein
MICDDGAGEGESDREEAMGGEGRRRRMGRGRRKMVEIWSDLVVGKIWTDF